MVCVIAWCTRARRRALRSLAPKTSRAVLVKARVVSMTGMIAVAAAQSSMANGRGPNSITAVNSRSQHDQ